MAIRNGISAGVSLIIGFPKQTLDEIICEICTLFHNNILILAINPLYPLPGTPMYYDCVKKGILTGEEDYICLGGDNFPIYNEEISQVDLYYLWVGVRAVCKWNIHNGKYMSFKIISMEECMELISNNIQNCLCLDNRSQLLIPIQQTKNEIYSGDHKILADMIAALVYLRTGAFYEWEVKIHNQYLKAYHMNQKKNIPKALSQLYNKMRDLHDIV